MLANYGELLKSIVGEVLVHKLQLVCDGHDPDDVYDREEQSDEQLEERHKLRHKLGLETSPPPRKRTPSQTKKFIEGLR